VYPWGAFTSYVVRHHHDDQMPGLRANEQGVCHGVQKWWYIRGLWAQYFDIIVIKYSLGERKARVWHDLRALLWGDWAQEKYCAWARK
jgi:hypothetical protein